MFFLVKDYSDSSILVSLLQSLVLIRILLFNNCVRQFELTDVPNDNHSCFILSSKVIRIYANKPKDSPHYRTLILEISGVRLLSL